MNNEPTITPPVTRASASATQVRSVRYSRRVAAAATAADHPPGMPPPPASHP